MFMPIPTWVVTIEGEGAKWDNPLRVPDSYLDAVLHVLAFNRYEFRVERQKPESVSIGELFEQSTS